MESEQDGIVNRLMEEMVRMKMQQQTTIQEMEAEQEKMVLSLTGHTQSSPSEKEEKAPVTEEKKE